MNKYLKIFLFGFLIWLIPFVVSIIIFPFHQSNRPLFESIMPVTVTLCVVVFAILYFKKINADIGLTYLIMPTITVGMGWVLNGKR
jgi:hypothetical protein